MAEETKDGGGAPAPAAAPAAPAPAAPAAAAGATGAAGAGGAGEAAGEKKAKRKAKKSILNGIVHVQATFNNTMITITDVTGNVVAWSSAGARGFKGSRKSTPFAAQVASGDAAAKAMENGMKNVEVRVKGPGAGRESALRAIASSGLKISKITDVTPIPHNGCRQPKRRRV